MHKIDTALIERIAADLAPYADDERTFLDTLDGETDFLSLLDKLIEAEAADRATASAIDERMKALRHRANRIEWRADALRCIQRDMLTAAGLRKIERPAATLSIRAGSLSVQITDADAVPTQLRRPGPPDKAAIKAAIKAGEDVPGVHLEHGMRLEIK
jgi:hypothetical protein